MRAAESTGPPPSTSDYLLTGLARCVACEGAYVGVSAHGRSDIYRYQRCRTRQVSGARGCPGHRVPADDLPAAVMDMLLDLYDDLDRAPRLAEPSGRRIELSAHRHQLGAHLLATTPSRPIGKDWKG